MADLVSRYPKIFGHMKRGPFWSGFVNHYFEPVIPEDFDAEPEDMKPGQKRDEWGILWGTSEGGVGRHPFDSEAPLADWKVLDTYQPPDPADYRDRHGRNWDEIEKHFGTLKEKGQRTRGDGGELFTRLYYLRGFNNLMIDIGTDDPGLLRLLDMVKAYEDEMVRRWMSIGVDSMYFHTDIGMQDRLMISPEKFRQWIKPWFKKIFLPVKNAGIPIDLSTDGHLLEIVDDLVECGVTSLQAQVRANTLEGIEKYYKGKLHIGLDLDRQMFAFCSPSDIREQVREAVERLWLPEGGLGLSADVIDPNTPLENIEALCQAGYEYCLANMPDPV
ncbi:MAG: uroporphyrinogen decarboxylase family protein [Candidatus Hydrogenedentes bacterium]|nr:uroporphyrinogen decarboxylase family protein [Candidatus Hydrogenedentota bacterium]